MKRCMGLLVGFGVLTQISLAQSPPTNAAMDPVQQRLKSLEESLNHLKHDLAKAVLNTRDLVQILAQQKTCREEQHHADYADRKIERHITFNPAAE